MQLFSIFQFISWSQFCEWLDLKIALGHHVDTNLKSFRNNSILVESWLTFGPQLLMRLRELRYCYTIKFGQKGTIFIVEAICFSKLSASFQSISTFFGWFQTLFWEKVKSQRIGNRTLNSESASKIMPECEIWVLECMCKC